MKLAKLSALATIIVTISGLVSANEAQGQGILRRLQSRVQARRTLPPTPPAAQPGRNTASNAGGAASGPSPTVAPAPTAAAPSLSANGPRSQYAPLGSRNGRPDPRGAGQERPPQDPRRPQTPDRPAGGAYGGSILEFGFDDAEEADRRQKAEPPRSGAPPQDSGAYSRPSTAQPTLGIDVFERAEPDGIQVNGFRPESRADEQGLKPGDVIVAMNNVPVRTIRDAANLLARTQLGDTVAVRIRRGQRDATLDIPVVARVVAAAKPPVQDSSTTGLPRNLREMAGASETGSTLPGPISVADLGIEPGPSGTSRARGVQIVAVVPDSPAAMAGIEVGDRLVSIDGRLLINIDTLRRELGRLPAGKEVSTRVVRNRKLLQNRVTLLPQSQWPDESQVADTPSSSNASSSVLGGLGSALGGWFGGNPASGSGAIGADESPTINDVATKEAAAKENATEIDEMALGDEWDPGLAGDPGVAGDRGGPQPVSDPSESLDPQSLESIQPPAKPTGGVEEEIERLERQLEALKAKAASGS